MRNVSRFRLRAQLSLWNPTSGAVEVATVTSIPVLRFKMRCMSFFTVKTGLCALRNKFWFRFSLSVFRCLSVETPHIVHALPTRPD